MTRELRALAADPFAAAVLLLGALLCFGNLGGRGLWQDEAETAMLARRALAHGVPLADDGVNAVSVELGRDRGADGVWNWSPWLPIYAEAASFRLFGESETAARLPFALAGWLCLPAVFLLSRRWFDSLWAARFSALALALSTPFLLNVRQARGYALAALAVAAMLLSLDGLAAGRRRAPAAFAAAALVLFYTNYLVALAVFTAVIASVALLKPGRAGGRRLAFAAAAVSILALPGILYFRVLSRPTAFDAARFISQLGTGAVMLLAHVLPWPFLFGSLWAAAKSHPQPTSRRVRFLLCFIAAAVAVLALAPWLFFRYLIPLAPAAAVLIGFGLDLLRRRSRAAAVGAVVLLGTQAFALVPFGLLGLRGARWADSGPLGSPWLGLVEEIGSGYPSCDKAAAAYVKERAAPGDVVLTNYGDTVLQFETGLRVRGGDQGPPWPASPDWAVMHPYEISRDPGRDWEVLQFFRSRAAPGGAGYSVEPFRCADPVLADAPDPDTHRFTAPTAGSSLLVLRRR
jgi:4-amino-4-deoxy-L-arabinose transferase-like glycosyltransferase